MREELAIRWRNRISRFLQRIVLWVEPVHKSKRALGLSFLARGNQKQPRLVGMPFSEKITALVILGRLCQIVVDTSPVKRNRAYLNVKLFVCTLCTRSLKFHIPSLKDNSYHVYQTEVSRTIISDWVNYSGLFMSQHNCYAALLFGCELNRLCEYFCILVLSHSKIWLYYCNCYIAQQILVYFIYHSGVSFNNK